MAKSQLVNALGIDTIKTFIRRSLDGVHQLLLIDANKDGRISGLEGFMAASQLGNSVIQIAPMWPDVKSEKADLTPEEMDELVEYVVQLELMPGSARPEIEATIDDIMRGVTYNIKLVKRIRDRFRAQQA
jgi:hypothetical protein